MFSSILPDDRTADGRSVWELWTPIVDALLAGEAVTIHRYELPDSHEQAPPRGGDPGDLLTLGPDDVLRPFDRSTLQRGSGLSPPINHLWRAPTPAIRCSRTPKSWRARCSDVLEMPAELASRSTCVDTTGPCCAR